MIQLKYPDFWFKRNLLSTMLVPASWVYKLLGWIRQIFTRKIKLSQKVICIGNITVGGSGKTQVVMWLAKRLKAEGISFVVVTKAYRSKLQKAVIVTDYHTAKEVGDESLMLKDIGPVIAAKKIQNAVPLIRQMNPQIVILDDGMQNPTLRKDLIILTLDALIGMGNGRILPAGFLRESLKSGLDKADIILQIGKECKDTNLINTVHSSKKPYFLSEIRLKEQGLSDKKQAYIAFAGIGYPEKFFLSLKRNDFFLQECIAFPDHHNYSSEELERLLKLSRISGHKLITTEKDYVRLKDDYKKQIICVKAELVIENEQKYINLIYEKLSQKI